jgi:hypothetical protein
MGLICKDSHDGSDQRHNQADHQGGFSSKVLRPSVFRAKQGSDERVF